MLDDYQSAPIAEGLRATLCFLDTMTPRPEALTAQDAGAVLSTGVSREALAEAVHVAYLFNIYDLSLIHISEPTRPY